jgi:hypothetical protein
LGDVTEPAANDLISIGDFHPKLIPGVFAHACAALMATGPPLLELTEPGRLVVDMGVTLLILGFITGVRLLYAWKAPRAVVQVDRLFHLLTYLAIMAACLIAVAFLHQTRIIWTDFTAVSIGLLVHLLLHHPLRNLPGRLRAWWNRIALGGPTPENSHQPP